MSLSRVQFSGTSSFKEPSGSGMNVSAAKMGTDRGFGTVGSMGNPLGMRMGGASGIGIGASAGSKSGVFK